MQQLQTYIWLGADSSKTRMELFFYTSLLSLTDLTEKNGVLTIYTLFYLKSVYISQM